MTKAEGWRWKIADQQASLAMGLRYEPGNWGDILKAAWILASIETVIESLGSDVIDSTVNAAIAGAPRPDRRLRLLDPFCGRPEYPLTPASADRLARVEELAVTEALEPWLLRGVVPSTGRFLMQLATDRGLEAEFRGFDLDAVARKSWSMVSKCELLDLGSGYDALEHASAKQSNAILIDPYDLFDQKANVWQRAAALARERFVLLYLYNKSSRGEGFFRGYQTLRKNLRDCLRREDGVAGILGRVPADAVLPRAHHEVVLLGPAQPVETLRVPLTNVTRQLARLIREDHDVEDPEA